MARCVLCDTDDGLYCQACVEKGIGDRDEAVALLRAIWHQEGPDKWPDPKEFCRRVEALVGPAPPTGYSNRPRQEP